MASNDGRITVNDVTYDIVTLDFETFYDTDYTLSGKINMSEYIRDSRFFTHGVGIKIRNNKAKWYSANRVRDAFKTIDWSKTVLLAHNTAFDGFILSDVFGHIPAFYLDTLGMSRAVHGHHEKHDLSTLAQRVGLAGKTKGKALVNTKGVATLSAAQSKELGEYCVDDVDMTYAAFWSMYDHVPDRELQLIDLTLRMFCDPQLEIDLPRVQDELEKEVGAKVAALLRAGVTAESLMSNQKFAELLGKHTKVPMKHSLQTGRPTFAFAKSDAGFQQLLTHSNPEVVALAEARLKIKSTIGETRAVRFIEAGKDGNKLPILLNYSGAHTHRWSGGNKMNLQNLKRGGELRRSILAPAGHVVVVVDSAQIEARILAWLANQLDVVMAFANGEDVYKLMASAIYNVPVKDVTDDQRFIGKICVLGLGYGMGAAKLQSTLENGVMGPPVQITLHECSRIVNIYRSKNHNIVSLWKAMDGVLSAMGSGTTGTFGPLTYGRGYIQLPGGLFLQYFGLDVVYGAGRFGEVTISEASYMTRYGRKAIYGGLLTENVVQALAREVIAEQMLEISKKYRIVTMTHDEIVAICPAAQADQCLADMTAAMLTAPSWAMDLPLGAKGGFDVCYSK